MLLDYIVSVNVARRHLNPGQKAMAALALEPMFAAAIKAAEAERKITPPHRSSSPNTTPDREQSPASVPLDAPNSTVERNKRTAAAKSAKATGASRTMTAKAKTVKRDAPDLAAKVSTGETTLDAAYKQARQRARNEPRPEPVKAGPASLTLFTHDGVAVSYPGPKGKATFNETRGEGISWASWSWNPVTGCLHGFVNISHGCVVSLLRPCRTVVGTAARRL